MNWHIMWMGKFTFNIIPHVQDVEIIRRAYVVAKSPKTHNLYDCADP